MMHVTLLVALTASPTEPAMDAPRERVPAQGLTLSYYGETLGHAGAVIGYERVVLSDHTHELLGRAVLGFYFHPRLYTAAFTGVEAAYRATASFGLRGELAVGAAYLHSLLAGPVYEAGPDGHAAETNDWGRPGFTPSLSAGAGWDFSRNGLPPLAVLVRPQVFWQYPLNTRWLMHFAVQVGLTYSF